jgi:ubiquinone biosynthesis protein COQ4
MIQRIRRMRGVLSMVRLVRDPDRLGEVFAMADALVKPEILDEMVAAFSRDAKGARALEERPRVGNIDLAALRELPEGTLGRVYADHMIENGLDPTALPSMEAPTPRAYVRAHLYESHDIWHAVTGFRTDVAGELGLQAFNLAQFPSRLAVGLLAMGLLNAVIFHFDETERRMAQITRGWAMGKRARPLFGTAWSSMWGHKMDDVRRDLGIDLDGSGALPAIDTRRAHEAARATQGGRGAASFADASTTST